ncbi:sigma 54-interacting transcriptional regulator [Geosporobacter ferrireducens]|uniref:Sigma-54-dependent Fis family transcriptional regulator n=1 Tax=Geosporobacter ferrireducens TaxID=1424294 RepID=A0A1D8GBD7_9FIRM|nr:sigma 54-interacting transcriptional regulator [Geosporobacter ferrireducens]AOT68212.1 hypothetical protein Gferi_00590 [Geosporobacter ferrireducens]MTI57372.1 CBS domain-containing protein [Geosporobacter ferrireducens]
MLENNLLYYRIREILSTNILKILPHIYLSEAIEKMLYENIPEVIIVENFSQKEIIKGILTLADVSRIKKENIPLDLPVAAFMQEKVVSVDIDELVSRARETMIENRIGRLPVTEHGGIVGIIRSDNLRDSYYMKLESINRQYKQIIHHMHEAVTVTDAQGHILVWNKNAEKLYDMKCEDLIYKKLEDFFPNALTLSVLNEREPIENVYHSPKPNYYVIISALPIYIDDEFVGVVATERDVTEFTNLSLKLENANSEINLLREEVRKITTGISSLGHIQGKNPKMQKKIQLAKHVSQTDTSVLITGESGTGKEVLAIAIHQNSGRTGHFVPVNCSAIPYTLFESEFFGYVGGAFTGALRGGKPGLIELANGGTLFLDEIGDLSIEAQAKLLRVLQEKKVVRVGAGKPIDVDIRIISATNKNLKDLVQKGSFREDLYYRLNVVEIELPPLRERKEDIILLFNHFLKEICRKNKIRISHVEKDVFNILLKYGWKGNIRELKNTVEYMVVVSKNGVLDIDLIPQYILDNITTVKVDNNDQMNLEEIIKRSEADMIKKALTETKGNKAKAAKMLNIPRSTLYYKLKLYDLEKASNN